jgi:hypothetical protein
MIVRRLYYPKWFDQTDMTISLTTQDEDGDEIIFHTWQGKGNYQESNIEQATNKGEYEHISGVIRSKGDIFPNISDISSGFAVINGKEVKILKSERVRNPDGTINHTKITLL